MSQPLTFRACTTVDDFQKCVELQKIVWEFADADLLPRRLFVVAHKIGGQIFGAFEPGGRLAGFCLSIPGLRNGRSYLHSHMLGVLPEYQNQRVGRALKLMQRDDALRRGIPVIEWTFDPLELKNAFFNIERLGCIMRRYIPNNYGLSTSVLHAGLPTDRLVAEWWVASERVRELVEHSPEMKSGPRPIARPNALRITAPADIGDLKARDQRAGLAAQTRLREQFLDAFRQGYVVTGFEPGEKESAYLLEKTEEPTL